MHSCYTAFRNCAHAHTRARAPTFIVTYRCTQRLEEMGWRYGSHRLVGWKQEAPRVTAWFLSTSPGLILSHSFFKLQRVLLFSFFPVAVQQTKPSWVTAQDCSMQSWLVCPIAWFIGCQSRSAFLFSVFAVCARTTDWNKCSVGCSKAMIDPNGVTMAIRSQTPASASDGVLHHVVIF